jgi:hypothetical protein
MNRGSSWLIVSALLLGGAGACSEDGDEDGSGASSGNGASGAGGASGTTAAGGSGASGGGSARAGTGAGGAGSSAQAGGGGRAGGASGAGSGAGGSTAGSGGGSAGDVAAGSGGADADAGEPTMTFFVTSTGNTTANLGGLDGADMKCQQLAMAAGHGDKTWRAYLSVEEGPSGTPVHAKDRIGAGPWHNADGMLVAADLTELHAREGDYTVFIDELGEPVPGQWQGSPAGNVHDILTGSNRDGTLSAGYTCEDWTSESEELTAWVGHSDGLGPGGSMDANYRPWNSVHENGGCHDTMPRGGGGRIYCFATGE